MTKPNHWRTRRSPAADRARRADVQVTFTDGAVVALEVQRCVLTDGDWRERHQDYQKRGITDVWIYPPSSLAHEVLFTAGQHLWRLDTDTRRLGLGIAAPHERRPGWETETDMTRYVSHTPPCVGDRITTRWAPLDHMILTPSGIAVPVPVAEALQAERDEMARRAKLLRVRKAHQPKPRTKETKTSPPADTRKELAGDGQAQMRPPGPRRSSGEGESGWGDRAWICPRCGYRTGLTLCMTCDYRKIVGR
jgi:hypothetical protein